LITASKTGNKAPEKGSLVFLIRPGRSKSIPI
jgi:hypothetical protein